MSIFATYVMAFEQGRFIMRNLENSYPHVDKIYILYSKYSFKESSKERYENTFDLDIIRNSPYMDKITILEGEWESDISTRNACLEQAKLDNVDFLMCHDADEYYFHDDFKKLVEYAKANPEITVFSILVKAFWRSFENIIINHDGSEICGCNQTVLNVNHVNHYDYVRDVHTNNIVIVNDIICYHGSYVLTNEEVYRKIRTWAHANDFDTQSWYEEVWLKWTYESRGLHPIWPWAWLRIDKYNGELPEVLKGFTM